MILGQKGEQPSYKGLSFPHREHLQESISSFPTNEQGDQFQVSSEREIQIKPMISLILPFCGLRCDPPNSLCIIQLLGLQGLEELLNLASLLLRAGLWRLIFLTFLYL